MYVMHMGHVDRLDKNVALSRIRLKRCIKRYHRAIFMWFIAVILNNIIVLFNLLYPSAKTLRKNKARIGYKHWFQNALGNGLIDHGIDLCKQAAAAAASEAASAASTASVAPNTGVQRGVYCLLSLTHSITPRTRRTHSLTHSLSHTLVRKHSPLTHTCIHTHTHSPTLYLHAGNDCSSSSGSSDTVLSDRSNTLVAQKPRGRGRPSKRKRGPGRSATVTQVSVTCLKLLSSPSQTTCPNTYPPPTPPPSPHIHTCVCRYLRHQIIHQLLPCLFGSRT